MGSNFLATAASGSVNNSNFDATNGTWTGAGNTGLGHVASPVHSGSGACQMTSQAAGNMNAAHCTAATILAKGMPVKPGMTVAVSGWFIAATLARNCQIGCQFYTSGGILISALLGPVVPDNTLAWVQAIAKLIAPTTSAFCRAYTMVAATAAIGEVHGLDDVVMYLLGGAIPVHHWWADEYA